MGRLSDAVHAIDVRRLAQTEESARVKQRLLHPESGGPADIAVTLIRTPPGDGSPAGLHQHPYDQVFHLIEGTMTVEVDGDVGEVSAPSLIHFPAHTPHRNWNASSSPTLHLSIAAPAPRPGQQKTIALQRDSFGNSAVGEA